MIGTCRPKQLPIQLNCVSNGGMIFRTITAFLAAAALPFTALAQAPEYQDVESRVHLVEAPTPSAADDVWPFAASDLPLDPAYRVGVLDNGMRYVIRPNGTPEGQGMVYFWVDAGSLAEEEDQLGYAHFVEHMAFNGSANVPEGEMLRLLEREGLAFGADTNASTSFDTTVYMLNLPRNDDSLLDTAMMIMRETASELLFDPEAVAREIGVIQAERRVRDTFQLRNQIANIAFNYPGSRFAARMPIGEVETIANATAGRLRDYYETYYRPDNTAIVVVGDFDADEVEALITQYFASWQPATGDAPASAHPSSAGPFDYDLQGLTDIYIDPALSETITAARTSPWIDRPDTVATRRERVLRQIAYGIINRRLQRLQRVDSPPFRAAGLVTQDVLKTGRSTNLVVQAAEGEWARGLAAAQEEYRRALEFGFTDAEVGEQVANLRASIESNAAGAATRHNNNFITGALTLLRDGQVPTTPQSALERFTAHEPAITPDSVLKALRADIVPLDNPLIRFTGRTAPEGGAPAIRAAWDAGMEVALEARTDEALDAFAYDDFGAPGTITSDVIEPVLGIRTIAFANGVKLNLKKTDLQEDRVSVELNVDGGQLLDTRENPLATAMTDSLLVGGLGAHSLDELQSILAGRQVGLNISADDETFRFSATTRPFDLDMQIKLFAATIVDPGYRPQGEEQYRRSIQNWFARYRATPGSALSNAQSAIVADNDPRFSLQDEQDYLALTFARLRDAIGDRFANGAIELALVGDFDEDEVIALVARTFGALPAREDDFRAYDDNRDRSFTADRSPRVVRHEGEANQAMIRMIWPTRDGEDLHESLKLELLERLTDLRLIDSLREELGQTYSPSARANQSRTYPGYGTFTITAEVDSAQVEPARAAMIAAIEDLRSTPAQEDELLRARAPQLEAYDNLLKTNGGWMRLVDRAQSQPDRITRYAQGREVLEVLTPQEIQAVARQYLDPAERLEITALPKEGAE